MAEITTYEAMPFPLAKPNKDTFVTQAENIGYKKNNVKSVLNELEENVAAQEKSIPVLSIITIDGVNYLKVSYVASTQSPAICGLAICGKAICGTK